MPIYEYKCSECGEKFEKLVSLHSTQEIECPKCGSTKVRKLISLFGSRRSDRGFASASVGSSCSPTGG